MLKLGGPDLIANHLWGIVLAGRVSDRLPGRRPLARLGRRSTWLPAAARPSLFRQALERASRLIPEERLVAVLARDHSAYYDTELQDLPAVRRIRQPMYRGSAPEVFLPALRIAQEDPHATVVVLPSDQLVEGEARFMNYVGRAAQAVGLRPELPVVIGAHPLSPDPACPWIEPGPPIEGLEAFAVRSVKRFLLRPSPGEVAALYEGDGLVNTQVIIAKARALIDIGRRHLPDVLETLEPLEAAFGAPEESLLAEALYEQMPYADSAPCRRCAHVAPRGAGGSRSRLLILVATSLARRSRPTLADTTVSDVRRGLSLFGIQVRLDLSCLFALGLGAWTFADTVLPEAAVGRLAGAYWAAGLAASALLLVSLAVHELAHGAAARRSGLLPHRVALSVFGGVTAFHREPDSPQTEFKIALAGPLASSGVALLGAVVHVALVELAADPLASAVAAIVAVGNLAVVALNLAPALPLDGGHALRAALWRLTGDPDTATRVASSIGRGLGAGLLVLAVVASASGDTAIALWSAMLGLVVFQHASQARARARVRQVSERAAALSRPAA